MTERLACPNCGRRALELNDDRSRTCAECRWTLKPSPVAREGLAQARKALREASGGPDGEPDGQSANESGTS